MEYDLDPSKSISSLDSWMLKSYQDMRVVLKAGGVLAKFKKQPLGKQIAYSSVKMYETSVNRMKASNKEHSGDSTAIMIDINSREGCFNLFAMHSSSFVIGAIPEYVATVHGDGGFDTVLFEPQSFIITPKTYDALGDTKPLTEKFRKLMEGNDQLDNVNFTIFIDLMNVDFDAYDSDDRVVPCPVGTAGGVFISNGESNDTDLCQYLVAFNNTDGDLAMVGWPEGGYDDSDYEYGGLLKGFEQLSKKVLILEQCEPSTPVPRIPKGILGTKKPRSGLLKSKIKPFSLFKQKVLNPRHGKNYEGKGGSSGRRSSDRWWLVVGFWRSQHYGPRLLGRTKTIWIAPHFRGNRDGVKLNPLIIK